MFNSCCEQTIISTQQYYLYKGFNNQTPKRVPVRESQVNLLVQETAQPFRLYARSKGQEEMRQFTEKKALFVDKDFPPNEQSLGEYVGRKIEWRRLSKIFKQFQKSVYTPMDLLLMKDGDSYFLAALLAMSQNYVVTNDIFDNQIQVSKSGAYQLKLSIKGKPQELIIDDYVPVFSSNIERGAFCHLDPSIIWVVLLEKAYAKINGSYQRINVGYAHEVFVTFSLAPCIYQVIPTDFRHEEQEKCWKTIEEAIRQRFPTVCGSRKSFTCQQILPNQTYCLKNCYEIPKKGYSQRRVILWDLPRHGPKQNGPYIEYQQDGRALNIPLVQFMRNFEVIDVSHHRKNFNSHFYEFKSDSHTPMIYTFDNSQKADTYFTLHRESGSKGFLRLILISSTDSACFELVEGKKEDIFGDVTIRINNLAKNSFYLICESGSSSNCILSVYTISNLTLKQFNGSKIQLLQLALSEQSKKDTQNQQRLGKRQQDWYCSKSLFQQLGIGYFALNLGLNTSIKCQLFIHKKELSYEGLNLINKAYKQTYFVVLERGSQQLLIFEFVGKMTEVFSFPPNSLQLKMII